MSFVGSGAMRGGGKRACVRCPSCSNSNPEEGLFSGLFDFPKRGVDAKSGEKEGGKQKFGTPDRNTRGARNVIPDHLVCVVRLGQERAMGQGSAIARFAQLVDHIRGNMK